MGMKDRLKGALYTLAGALCLLAGVAGVVLPIIPGIPLILLGLHLIGVKMPFLDKHIASFRRWLEARQQQSK